MRVLLDDQMQDVRVAEAVALFCYQIKKQIDDLRQHWDELDQLVRGWHRRTRANGPRPDMRGAGIPWNRTRREAKRGGQPGCDLHHVHGRSTDDCTVSLSHSRP